MTIVKDEWGGRHLQMNGEVVRFTRGMKHEGTAGDERPTHES